MAQTKQIEKAHKIADIYDRLNNQQDLQEIISKYVLELLYAEDREIWLTKHKKNHDLLTIEWELFVEVEMNEDWRKSFGVEDYYRTPQSVHWSILGYAYNPGQKISPIGYDICDCGEIYNTKTISRLPEKDRHNTVLELIEEDRLHCCD